MKIVNAAIKKISINKFSPKEKMVDIDILFSDGNEKEISKTMSMDNPAEDAQNLIDEVANVIRNAHKEFNGENILDSVVNVKIVNEKDALKNITHFFNKISLKIENMKDIREPSRYLHTINEIKSIKLDL